MCAWCKYIAIIPERLGVKWSNNNIQQSDVYMYRMYIHGVCLRLSKACFLLKHHRRVGAGNHSVDYSGPWSVAASLCVLDNKRRRWWNKHTQSITHTPSSAHEPNNRLINWFLPSCSYKWFWPGGKFSVFFYSFVHVVTESGLCKLFLMWRCVAASLSWRTLVLVPWRETSASAFLSLNRSEAVVLLS